MKLYHAPDGRTLPYPEDRDTAAELSFKRYLSPECDVCGPRPGNTPSRFVLTDRCVLCSMNDMVDFYNVVTGASQYFNGYVSPGADGKPLRQLSAETALFFEDALPRLPAGFQPATRPCETCGYPRVSLPGTKCLGCKLSKPRQVAAAAGRTWYTPVAPCALCGHKAPRRVSDGICSQCKGVTPREDRPAPEDPLADVVITREQAEAAGMPYYRTGKPCKYGHLAARYVSTGACRECIKSRP